MRRDGFTLLELTVSMAVLTMVMGVLFALATGLAQSTKLQQAKITADDDARNAMMFLVRDIRQASSSSIPPGTLPGSVLFYQVADDVDGNGTAVGVGGNLELSPMRTLMRDLADINGDGLTDTQLVMVEGTEARVVGNGLLPDEDINNDGVLDPGEDANSNGRLERGLWFEQAGRGIRITVQTQRLADPRGLQLSSSLIETVVPRN
jgi:prepilin-type N-terminal cleavage/methylation domain-containing protein